MTPGEVKVINDLTAAAVAQRDVVVWLAQSLAQQPSVDVVKLRADFLLAADALRQRKGLAEPWREEVRMIDASLRLGAIRRDPPLELPPLDEMI